MIWLFPNACRRIRSSSESELGRLSTADDGPAWEDWVASCLHCQLSVIGAGQLTLS
jgi:hypothetical protein